MEKFSRNSASPRENISSRESSPTQASKRKNEGAEASQLAGRNAYRSVEPQPDFPRLERRILRFWEENQAFQKRVALNTGGKPWSFMDGPITANNPMGVHHAWGRTLKDLFQRYKAMHGFDLRHQNGFDCQGLWVEVEVERELGFKSKRDIESFGIEEFVKECKKRVLRYSARIINQSKRLGCWMAWDNTEFLEALGRTLDLPNEKVEVQGPKGVLSGTPEELVGRLGDPSIGGSYFTFSDENNYSIWQLLKRCHQNGWIYKGRDVVPWCPRCSTALSEHEIATEGYEELTHPSLYVKFPLKDKPGEYLLVWTTTPWTLSSNVAVAVHPDPPYVKARIGEDLLYLAEQTLESLGSGAEIQAELAGKEMEGWTYQGAFDDMEAVKKANAPQSHQVILWDDVSGEEGTGLVHIAPGCGKEDFELGRNLGLPTIAPLDEFGVVVDGFGPLTGRTSEESSRWVAEELARMGLLFRCEDYTHRYPVCWRCGSELVFRLVDEWFISIDRVPRRGDGEGKTLRESIKDSAREVTWVPSFGLQRELDWLSNMEDWMISKKRYWGLALPIWACGRCGQFDVIGSREELETRSVDGWEEFQGHSPHRPWIDLVKIRCKECGSMIERIPDVGNPWLDAGIVSYSTLGYFNDREVWKKWFPSQLICESLRGQFRNWFYAMLTMSTILEGRSPFKACLGHGDVRDEDGREMHSSLGNAIWFDDAVEEMGADLMRWMYCSTSTARDLCFSNKATERIKRGFFLPLWNAYRFFATYAKIDGWLPPGKRPALTPMDRWILSRLQRVALTVTKGLEAFEPKCCTDALEGFVSDLSRWYLRGSRRRFWKNEADADKEAAYFTLHQCLVMLAQLMAPFTPFLSEELFQNLVRSVDSGACGSIHHTGWPEFDSSLLDPELEEAMTLAVRAGELGRSVRAKRRIKLRQPLRSAVVVAEPVALSKMEPLRPIMANELNVRSLKLSTERLEGYEYAESIGLQVGMDLEVDQTLREEGLAREIVRRVQKQRRDADLEVDDPVVTHYQGDQRLEEAMMKQAAYISQETLSASLVKGQGPACAYRSSHTIHGMNLTIAISRSP